jgi:LEA14-like dessication related protein
MSPRSLFGALCALVLLGCRTGPPLANGFDAQLAREQIDVLSQSYDQLSARELLEVVGPAGALVTQLHIDWQLDKTTMATTDLRPNLALEQDGHAVLPVKVTMTMARSSAELDALAKHKSLELSARGLVRLVRHEQVKEIELSASVSVPAPQLLAMSLGSKSSATRYGNGEIAVTLFLSIHNPNRFPVRVFAARYQVALAGELLADGSVSQGEEIGPSSTTEFEIDTLIDHSRDELLQDLGRSSSLPYLIWGEVSTEAYRQPWEIKGSLRLTNG